MKTGLLLLVVGAACLMACTSNNSTNQEIQEVRAKTVAALVDTTDNGVVTAYYPGRKVKKLTGRIDQDGKRHETWYFFKPDGSTGTVTTYYHGKKHGHTIVYHPNGALHYKGEYQMDKQVGEWKFYDTQGKLVKAENYEK